MEYLSLCFLFVLGLLMMLRPKWLWKIEHLFSVKGGEPTDFYLTGMTLGGFFFTLCAVGMLIYVCCGG